MLENCYHQLIHRREMESGERMVSIPTSKVLHPAARIEILAGNKNNNLDELLIFISGTFKSRIECITIEFPMIRIFQRDVTEKSLSCHSLVTQLD